MANLLKQVLIGPDGKLRLFLRAVIFYCLGTWVFYPLIFRVVLFLASPFHIKPGLSWQRDMLSEPTNLLVGVICTGIFAVYERRRIDSYGMPVNRALSLQTFEGAAAGVVMAGAVAIGMILLGGMQVKGFATSGAALGVSALGWFVSNTLVGISEELFYRSYLQITLWKSVGFWPASILIALVFTADHYFYKEGENIWDVITLMSLSLLISYSILRTGTLWFAVGFHATFDYMQLFVIGTPNGSFVPQGRLLDVTFNGPTWLTGGVLGTEASFLMYPAIVLLWLYVWWRYRRNRPLEV